MDKYVTAKIFTDHKFVWKNNAQGFILKYDLLRKVQCTNATCVEKQ